MTVRKQLLALERDLNCLSWEREEVVRGLLLALLSRQHLFVIGPPGADKSRLIVEFMNRIEGARSFTLLLTRFTTPEEIMGPLSIPALEKGVYSRITNGMLPQADLAFLDEIFKANSAILNALLQITNERLYRSAGQIHQAPLQSLFAASNELPQADELGPLYDRLLLRFEVSYLAEESSLLRLLGGRPRFGPKPKRYVVQLKDVELAQREITQVRLGDEAIGLVLKIRATLRQEGLTVSDRRLKQSLSVVKAQAWLEGRQQVASEDLEVLAHTLWADPKNRRLVADRVFQHASPDTAKALELRDLAAEQEQIALEKRHTSETEAAEAMTKLKSLHDSLLRLREDLGRQGRLPRRVERALLDVQIMRRNVLRECLGVEV